MRRIPPSRCRRRNQRAAIPRSPCGSEKIRSIFPVARAARCRHTLALGSRLSPGARPAFLFLKPRSLFDALRVSICRGVPRPDAFSGCIRKRRAQSPCREVKKSAFAFFEGLNALAAPCATAFRCVYSGLTPFRPLGEPETGLTHRRPGNEPGRAFQPTPLPDDLAPKQAACLLAGNLTGLSAWCGRRSLGAVGSAGFPFFHKSLRASLARSASS